MLSTPAKLRALLDRADTLRFARLFVAILGAAALEVVGIALILPFMRLVADPTAIHANPWLARAYGALGFPSERAMLLWTGVAVLAIFALSRVVSGFTSWLIHKSVWTTAHRICMRLLGRYLELPWEFFLARNSAELLRKVVADVHHLVNGVLLAGSNFVAQLVLSGAIFLLLVAVRPALALVAFAVFGGAYGVIHLLRHSFLKRLGEERNEADYWRFKSFSEALTGMKAIKTEGVATFFVRRFEEASSRFAAVAPKLQLVSVIPRYLLETLAFGGVLATVLYLLAAERDFVAAVPVLSLFALAAYRLLPALHEAFLAGAQLSHNLSVIDEVHRDMRAEAAGPAPQAAEVAGEETGAEIAFEESIRLRDVSFRYRSGHERVARGVDLTIPKHARIAFVGSTGSGKTTLIDILVGLLEPEGGAVLVDGVPLGPHNLADWLRRVAYVPQEVFLYDATIRANIAFGVEPGEIDDARLREAARVAQIAGFVEGELPRGYDTVVGERGVRLSGGQRQRLGLARAIYRRPEVLLLDEATSALDGITEEAVMRALGESLPGVTVVMVAHRLSTVKLCDRIYLVEAGRVVESGRWEELLERSGRFREMVERTR